jgi:hypothetical protein
MFRITNDRQINSEYVSTITCTSMRILKIQHLIHDLETTCDCEKRRHIIARIFIEYKINIDFLSKYKNKTYHCTRDDMSVSSSTIHVLHSMLDILNIKMYTLAINYNSPYSLLFIAINSCPLNIRLFSHTYKRIIGLYENVNNRISRFITE